MTLFDILKWLAIGFAAYFGLGYFLPRPLTRTLWVPQYEKVVVFSMGRLLGVRGPGLVLLWAPWHTVHARVDLRTESTRIPEMGVITRDQVELKAVGVEGLHSVDPARIIDWAVNTDEDARQVVREVGPQALTRAFVASHDFADLLSASAEGRLTIPVEALNQEVESTGRRFTSVMIRAFDIPDAVADEMAKAAQARIGALGINYTAVAFQRAQTQGVDQHVLAWREQDVREKLAERAVQPIEIRGGGGTDTNTALLAAILKRLLGEGGKT